MHTLHILMIQLLFLFLVSAQPHQQFIKIYLVGIEFGTIHTNKLRFTTNRYPAGSAHACTVNHNGIQTGHCGNIVFCGKQAGIFHHDCRANG